MERDYEGLPSLGHQNGILIGTNHYLVYSSDLVQALARDLLMQEEFVRDGEDRTLVVLDNLASFIGSCRVRAGAPGGPVVVSGKALISRSNFDDHPDPFPPRRPAGRRAQLRLAGHLSSSGGVAMSKGASASFGAMSAYSNACPDCRVSMSGVRACLQCLHRHGVEWDSISMLEDRDDASRISQRNSNSTDGRGDEPRSRQSPPLATPPSSALPRALSPPRLFATRKRKSTRCSRTPGRRGFRTSIPRILHAVAATNVQATERSRTIVHRSSERSDVSPGRCEWT